VVVVVLGEVTEEVVGFGAEDVDVEVVGGSTSEAVEHESVGLKNELGGEGYVGGRVVWLVELA
jgi:hypothetical protein